jgi:hypothetical protein
MKGTRVPDIRFNYRVNGAGHSWAEILDYGIAVTANWAVGIDSLVAT